MKTVSKISLLVCFICCSLLSYSQIKNCKHVLKNSEMSEYSAPVYDSIAIYPEFVEIFSSLNPKAIYCKISYKVAGTETWTEQLNGISRKYLLINLSEAENYEVKMEAIYANSICSKPLEFCFSTLAIDEQEILNALRIKDK